MKYIEFIVMINILIHLSFVRLSNLILRKRNNWLLIILSILLDVIYTIIYLIHPEIINNYRYLIVLIISIIPFLSKSLSSSLTQSLIYLMLNFILGGTSGILFKIINHYFVVLICLFLINIFFILYIFINKKVKFKPGFTYQIKIIDKGKEYILNGFYDSGNFLVNDDNIPIVFINKKYKIGRYIKQMKIQTINISNYISLYKIDYFSIKITDKFIEKDVYISFSDIYYDCMFGSELL